MKKLNCCLEDSLFLTVSHDFGRNVINDSICCLSLSGLGENEVHMIMIYIRNDTFVLPKYAA